MKKQGNMAMSKYTSRTDCEEMEIYELPDKQLK